jgi:hypothetical protein
MPIEIKEVVIRAVVSGTGGGGGKGGSAGGDQAAGSPDHVVQEAVRQTLDILRDTDER